MTPTPQPQYGFGTPSLDEWHGLWKTSPTDSNVTESEFNAAFKSLGAWLSQRGRNGVQEDCDYFVVGDCHGDKTQCVELVNPNVLTLGLLHYLQQWLRLEYPSWRIVIPTFLHPRDVIIVYLNALRVNQKYEGDLARALDRIRQQMFQLEDYRHLRHQNS